MKIIRLKNSKIAGYETTCYNCFKRPDHITRFNDLQFCDQCLKSGKIIRMLIKKVRKESY